MILGFRNPSHSVAFLRILWWYYYLKVVGYHVAPASDRKAHNQAAAALIGSRNGLVLLSVRAFLAEIMRDSMGLKGRAKLRVPCPLAGTGTTERKGDRKNVGKTH